MNQPDRHANTPRFAAVDVGSNSLKLRIAARLDAGHDGWQVLYDEVVVTGLGRGLSQQSALAAASRAAALSVLRSFAQTITTFDCAGVAAVGTQCLREASDGAEFAHEVRSSTGLPLEIISGQDEVRLAFLGASTRLRTTAPDVWLAVMDIGGRSTEFGFGRPDRLDHGVSLPVGVLGITERHFTADPVGDAALAIAGADVDAILAALAPGEKVTTCVGVGATPATLAAVAAGGAPRAVGALHGRRVGRDEVTRQCALYANLTLAERARLPGLHPDRAGVILAGAVLAGAALDRLGCAALQVGVHGLRQGLLRDRFEERTR